MPQYNEEEPKDTNEIEDPKEEKEKEGTKLNYLLLSLVLLWFFISGGMEGFFQSQTYTFGICGPHLMDPGRVRYPQFKIV